MTPVNVISGRAVPYPASNVDTDEIIPARFLFRDRKDGFADTLFRDLRFDAAGNARPEFVLNLPRYANPGFSSRATTSAAGHPASMPSGRCWTPASRV